MEKYLKIIISSALSFLLSTFVFQSGWNIFFVEVFKFPQITFYQAVGFLLVLSPIREILYHLRRVERENEEAKKEGK